MPDPITSSNSSAPPNMGGDPTLDDAGQVCRSDAPNSSEPERGSTPPAVTKLLSTLPPPASVLPPSAPSAPSAPSTPAPEAQNNAQRTTEHGGIASYAAAGVTGGARDALYAGAAALKGRDTKTGIEVEVFSASAQVGGENEAQAGLARLGISGGRSSVTTEFLTARAHGGAHNDDGSTGINAGALATGAGIEGTLSSAAESVTAGLSVSVGLAGSIGLRDADHDNLPELCVKGSVGFVTLGVCVELVP